MPSVFPARPGRQPLLRTAALTVTGFESHPFRSIPASFIGLLISCNLQSPDRMRTDKNSFRPGEFICPSPECRFGLDRANDR